MTNYNVLYNCTLWKPIEILAVIPFGNQSYYD